MTLSKILHMQLKSILSEMQLREQYMQKAVSTAAVRIQKLRQEGSFLETTFLNAQIIEKHLKLIIEGYLSRRRILNLLNEKDIFTEVKLDLDDEETLGHLIGIVKRLKIDPSLISSLGTFNQLRKEAVHHLFDSAKELATFDEQAKEYFISKECGQLYESIGKEQKKIRKEVEKIIKLAKK